MDMSSKEEMAQEIERLRNACYAMELASASAYALVLSHEAVIDRLKDELAQVTANKDEYWSVLKSQEDLEALHNQVRAEATEKERQRCLKIVRDSRSEGWAFESIIACIRQQEATDG